MFTGSESLLTSADRDVSTFVCTISLAHRDSLKHSVQFHESRWSNLPVCDVPNTLRAFCQTYIEHPQPLHLPDPVNIVYQVAECPAMPQYKSTCQATT